MMNDKYRNNLAIRILSLFVISTVLGGLLFVNNVSGAAPASKGARITSLDQDGSEPDMPEFDAQFQNNPEAEIWISCTPVEVAVYNARIHVRCAAAVAGIYFFALSTADASATARTLSILTAAHISGRTLDILYDPNDTSGASIGCQVNDCRLIRGVAVL